MAEGTRSRKEVKPWRITVHCSATANGQRVDISEIRKWHQAKGWWDVGYHAVIQPDGELQWGRSLTTQGAHVQGDNPGNIGICLIGTDKYTTRQLDALRDLIDTIRMTYDIQLWDIGVHNQYESARKQGKTCPGFSANQLLAWYIGRKEKALDVCRLLV